MAMMVILSTIRPSRTIASTSSKEKKLRSNSSVSSDSAGTGVSAPHEQAGDVCSRTLGYNAGEAAYSTINY